LELNWHNT
jgi:hypothetical protein